MKEARSWKTGDDVHKINKFNTGTNFETIKNNSIEKL